MGERDRRDPVLVPKAGDTGAPPDARALSPTGSTVQPAAGPPPSDVPPFPPPPASRAERLGTAVGGLAARLGPTDRAVLGFYLLTRVALALITYCSAWLFGPSGDQQDPQPFLQSWGQWDWAHLENIAKYGYFANPDAFNPGHPENREAFFPGFPLAVRFLQPITGSYLGAGMLVSLVAGGVAVVALARIAGLDDPEHADATGRRAALFLLVSPCAVFLAAPYTEALFLAFALPAWLAARRGAWVRACVLAAGATATRISGIFLVAAILVAFLLAGHDRRRWLRLPAFAVPALPLGAYMWYLHAHTGDWLKWKHVEEQGWYRTGTWPWDAWQHTWAAAFGHTQTAGYALEFQAELVAMVVGAVLLVVLVVRRRWAESLYVGLNVYAFGTSYWYMSVDRATLLWWPLWIGLAMLATRYRTVRLGWLAVSVPLAAVWVVGFTSGHWMG